MSICGKREYRVLLVSLLLIFSLNTVASAENFGQWELEVINRFGRLQEKIDSTNIYVSQILDRLTLVESYVEDIKDNLTYAGDSAAYYLYMIKLHLSDINSDLSYNQYSVAYYLYMIESHLSDIASGSGSSDSSSFTDLSEVHEWLETSTGLVGQISLYVSGLSSQLEQTNTCLYQVSTKLDGVSTMVTKLNVLNSSLNDVLEYLETSTGLLGLIQVASDATNVKLERTNNYLYQVSTKLDGVATMASSQNTANSYLLEISTTQQELDTTLSNIESALIYNETGVGRIMVALNENFLNRTSSIISTLTYNGGSVARYVSALNENFLVRSSDIVSSMTYNAASVVRSVDALNENFLNRSSNIINVLNTAVVNQQELIDLVSDLEITTNVTVENIENIAIDVTNKAYEVFYITDSDGNKQNISDFSGDVLSVGGRLLNFFFKVAFDDALDSVDSAIDDMTEFYLDDSVVLDGGGSLWE